MTPTTMDKQPDDPVHEEALHALLDGQLPAAERAALARRLEGDAQARALLQDWQTQRDALRRLHAPVLTEAVPSSLLAAAQRAQDARHGARQMWRWGGMAAGLLLAFGLGWFTHGQIPGGHGAYIAHDASPVPQAGRPPFHEFIYQATLAHAVYTPEVRHPVEVDATQEVHLVQWLSKRLGHPLRLPQLRDLGYELVGGRLLPGDDGARAQFMYQNAAGERVTLYLGKRPAQLAEDARVEFRYSSDGPVPSFYWIDQEQAYALSGAMGREQLLRLAEAVYRQL